MANAEKLEDYFLACRKLCVSQNVCEVCAGVIMYVHFSLVCYMNICNKHGSFSVWDEKEEKIIVL